MKMTTHDLAQFTGTEGYTRWSPLFRSMCLTDGAKFLAEKAGAYWLMDAIASHQPNARRKNADLKDFQLWTLKVKDNKATLTCQADSDQTATIRQRIEYTDFPLAEIKLYVMPLDEKHFVIMQPSEY
jgi:hypothetical protein